MLKASMSNFFGESSNGGLCPAKSSFCTSSWDFSLFILRRFNERYSIYTAKKEGYILLHDMQRQCANGDNDANDEHDSLTASRLNFRVMRAKKAKKNGGMIRGVCVG